MLALGLAEMLAESDALNEAEGDALNVAESDALSDADGLAEILAEAEAEIDADGEAEMLADALLASSNGIIISCSNIPNGWAYSWRIS